MRVTSVFLAFFLVLALTAVAAAVNPSRYWVGFSGHIESSRQHRPTVTSQFADFVSGAPFRGSFMFDFSLVDQTDSLILNAGQLRRYFSGVRDMRVEFTLPSRTYVYEPPEYGEGAFSEYRLNLWGVGNNVNNAWDGLDMRFHNYPARWANGPVGIQMAHVPTSQYVNGLYPHASYFILQDNQPPLDTLHSTGALFDMLDLFGKSNDRSFDMRFTNVNDPNWPGAEQLYAVLFGEITSLRISLTPIPEPATVFISATPLALLFTNRRRKSQRKHRRRGQFHPLLD